MIASARHRWLDRLLGAAIGIAVTAWWFSRARHDERASVTATESTLVATALPEGGSSEGLADVVPLLDTTVEVQPSDADAPVNDADAREVAVRDAVVAGSSVRDAAKADVATRDAAVRDAVPDEVAPPSDLDDAQDPTALDPEAAPPGTAPELPLPRMPGDTRLSGTARFDAESSSWVIKGAYRVHARDHHVIAFYRKALLDQGLSVSLAEDPPAADGAVKTYLRGKSSRVHAQVGIMPRVGTLETRVWILWRTRS